MTTTTESRAARRAEAQARKALHANCARHGWHLIGPGPARWGWAVYTPAGSGRFLGATAVVAAATFAGCSAAYRAALLRHDMVTMTAAGHCCDLIDDAAACGVDIDDDEAVADFIADVYRALVDEIHIGRRVRCRR